MSNIAGVSNIETDPDTNLCQFTLADANFDLKAKLDELAKTNEHIAGFQILSD